MIEEEAVVASIANDRVWVEKIRTSACASCSHSCATSVTSRLFSGRLIRVPVSSPSFPVKAGDRVVVGLDEAVLARGAFRIYLIPLLAMLAGAVFGQGVAEASGAISTDLGAALGGGLALTLSLLRLKLRGSQDLLGLCPVILRKVDQ